MNRHELLAIVLGGIVALGMAGGVVTSAAAASAADGQTDVGDGLVAAQDEDDETETETEEDGEQNETDEGDGEQNETIPITEAMAAASEDAQDRNGTVVGAELGQRSGGLLDFGEDDESVYTVDVLMPNGTHVEYAVSATNGSIVQSEEQEEGFLEGIFGEENVPQEPLNLSAMHNATEAVELAQNESDVNGTVTSVTLNDGDDNLVYEVEIGQEEGDTTTVVVDAMKDGEGVIEVDGEPVDGEMGGDETETETETEEGDDMDGGNEDGDEGGDGDEGN